MADRQGRKYLLTIQHPEENGFSHDTIKDILATMNITYFCMADDIAPTTGTPHTHVFLYRKGPIRESTIRRKFPGVHFDACTGSCAQNREYVSKAGKWANDPKGDTIVPGSFEEVGDLPDERQEKHPGNSDIIADVEAGKSTAEIIRDNPQYLFRSNDINTLRETLNTEEFATREREVTVSYLYGPTGVGKTRMIFDSHDAQDICRITNYGTSASGVRFDTYRGQRVLVFEEFASQIKLTDMLCYLDRYPVSLPARYYDRWACFDTVYLTSNIPLTLQYTYEQTHMPESWSAFLRRLSNVVEFLPDGSTVIHDKSEYL